MQQGFTQQDREPVRESSRRPFTWRTTMQKLYYLLFDSPLADGTKLREELCETAVPALRASGATEITVFA
jgi:hypothetical protein